eukprot:Hpha_TRINITY_DN13765_c0_g1::TRINITY_DN13765_c0_g1_i2::g.142772::m.142772
MATQTPPQKKGGIVTSLKKMGGVISKALGTKSRADKYEDDRWAPDAETGKIIVDVHEVDFVGTKFTNILFVSRHFAVDEGSDDEKNMISSLKNILNILRTDPIQRQLVRKKLFFDREPIEGKSELEMRYIRRSQREDERPLAGNLKQYFELCKTHSNVIFKECVIELLAIFLLGKCHDIQKQDNKPKKFDADDPTLLPGIVGQAAAELAMKAEIQRPYVAPPQSAGDIPKPKQDEIDYSRKAGAIELLDDTLHNKTLGIEPFCLMAPASQTLVWSMQLYRLFLDHEEVKDYALRKHMVKWTWEVVTRKTKMKEPRQERIAALKLSACEVLDELGKVSVNDTDDKTDLGRNSINMINMNSRSTKEVTKLLHNHPRHHPTLLSLLTMIGQKAENNTRLKEQGMMEYLTTKVLPFHSEHHQRCIPHLVILLNSWIVHPEDLDFFWQFNGIQCLVFHVENALSGDRLQDPNDEETNWEDMILHGLSILYKLSDRQKYHQKMVLAQAIPVLLECTRQIDPLKSLYHMNAFIAALYSLRNLTSKNIENRRLVAQNANYLILPHLLSSYIIPANCLIHLLFLFSNLTQDKDSAHRVDEDYRGVIMNDIFLSVFKPLCVIVQSTPQNKVLDDSQVTVLCLALQILATLVGIAKQENPLLCIQIEHDLPLQHLSAFTRAKTQTPFPRLANELLSLVYLVP